MDSSTRIGRLDSNDIPSVHTSRPIHPDDRRATHRPRGEADLPTTSAIGQLRDPSPRLIGRANPASRDRRCPPTSSAHPSHGPGIHPPGWSMRPSMKEPRATLSSIGLRGVRRAGAQGFEPCRSGLESEPSPRRTPLSMSRSEPKRKGRDSNPQGYSLARVPGGSRRRCSGGPSSRPGGCGSGRRGIRTLTPSSGASVSNGARPALSGCLPDRSSREWTAGESHPDLLLARQASCCWTSSPWRRRDFGESSRQDSNLRYPACKAGVLAAGRRDEHDHEHERGEWPGWESNPQAPASQTGGFASLPTRPANEGT